MSKNFCRIENKWCKFCKKGGFCNFTSRFNNFISLDTIQKCPSREKRETMSFREILLKISFDDIMKSMIKYWPEQEKNINGYRDVYTNLLNMKGDKLSNYFIDVEYDYFDEWTEDGKSKTGRQTSCPVSSAVHFTDLNKKSYRKHYSIDGFDWDEIASMNISQDTLDNIPYEDIISSTLFEMTFYGFTEEKVNSFYDELKKSCEEAINKRCNVLDI